MITAQHLIDSLIQEVLVGQLLPKFQKLRLRLPPKQQAELADDLIAWSNNPGTPRLRWKPIKSVKGLWEIRIGGSQQWRAMCWRTGSDTYDWDFCGTHKEGETFIRNSR